MKRKISTLFSKRPGGGRDLGHCVAAAVIALTLTVTGAAGYAAAVFEPQVLLVEPGTVSQEAAPEQAQARRRPVRPGRRPSLRQPPSPPKRSRLPPLWKSLRRKKPRRPRLRRSRAPLRRKSLPLPGRRRPPPCPRQI